MEFKCLPSDSLDSIQPPHMYEITAPIALPTVATTVLAAALSPAAPKDCSVAITPPDTGGPRYDIANAAMDPAAIPPAPNPSSHYKSSTKKRSNTSHYSTNAYAVEPTAHGRGLDQYQ